MRSKPRTHRQKMEATILIMLTALLYFGGPTLIWGLGGFIVAIMALMVVMVVAMLGFTIYDMID